MRNDRNIYVLWFPQKMEGSKAGRLPIFFWKINKYMVVILCKTEHKEMQRKQKISQSPSKKWPFKSHDVPTARGLLWFRENRVWNKGASAIIFFQHFGATWSILVPFLILSDLEGGSKIVYFWKQSKTNEKKEVQETVLKKHNLLIGSWC